MNLNILIVAGLIVFAAIIFVILFGGKVKSESVVDVFEGVPDTVVEEIIKGYIKWDLSTTVIAAYLSLYGFDSVTGTEEQVAKAIGRTSGSLMAKVNRLQLRNPEKISDLGAEALTMVKEVTKGEAKLYFLTEIIAQLDDHIEAEKYEQFLDEQYRLVFG